MQKVAAASAARAAARMDEDFNDGVLVDADDDVSWIMDVQQNGGTTTTTSSGSGSGAMSLVMVEAALTTMREDMDKMSNDLDAMKVQLDDLVRMFKERYQ